MMSSHLSPSRKDTIMIMTILGWAVCGIFSFVSYFMAKEDLRQMDAGLMDDRERSNVKLMQTVGLVHIVLMVGSILLGGCIVMASILSAGASGY